MTTANFPNWTTEFFAWADANNIDAEKFPRDAETLLSQTTLNLSFCKLTQLPESLGNLTHLTELDLAYNELTKLPEWIDNFTALRKLDVAGNSITSLPDSLRHLPNLVVLGLDKQMKNNDGKKTMMKKPNWIDELVIWLDKNDAIPYELNKHTFFDSGKLTVTTELDDWEIVFYAEKISLRHRLVEKHLNSFPDSICKLEHLKVLDLGNNYLTTIPTSISNLPELTELILDNNRFQEIPLNIIKLSKLEKLNLSDNLITGIPDWIKNLVCLKSIDLSNNPITEIAEDVLKIPKLKIIGLKQFYKPKTKMKTYQQKILFGSPGTGKSYKIDKEIIPFDLNIDIEKTPANVIKTVFHPEYTYGDFVGKLMPITVGGNVQYKFYEGHFLKALSQAYKNIIAAQDNDSDCENVALVIDEINRGNSAAIFGTIFQLLDRNPDGWSNYEVSVNEIIFNRLFELCDLKPHSIVQGKIKTYKFGDEEIEAAELQKKLNCHFENRTIKIPPNLSILASMNTSDSSIYYMDSAFKRRWEWEFIDVDSNTISVDGVAFETRKDWEIFVSKLNAFIKSNHKSIRGIEDKQIGHFFITDDVIQKSSIQNKLMFFLWDSVFNRDKKPLVKLLFDENTENELITFGDFAKEVDLFIAKINGYV